MILPRVHQVNSASITAAGNSGALQNLGRSDQTTVIAYLDINGPVTGTSPSLTVSVDGGPDGSTWANLGSFTAQTAVTAAGVVIRLVIHDVMDPFVRFSWTISGTTPNFQNVVMTLIMSSPDN